jgi:hypothetical protein
MILFIIVILMMQFVLDLQIIYLSYLDILNYEKNDIITSFACTNALCNKKIYDIWYKNSKHKIQVYIDTFHCIKEWYVNNRLHRDSDLPAREWDNGTKSWWINNRLHRDNYVPKGECGCIRKPAIEYKNGNKEWYKNGKRHRDNYVP